MPLLLVFLLGVISMRAWADENRMGSIELLMTLPIRTYELVVGKFLAGMVLVVIALSLTLPISIVNFSSCNFMYLILIKSSRISLYPCFAGPI